MMDSILKEIQIAVPLKTAFDGFLNKLNEWWPKEYTWSQDKLKEIRIDPKKNGLCTEIGPHGFRCDWGRVTELLGNRHIALKWQIGPNRDPIPDPEKASNIKIDFIENGNANTIMKFGHSGFNNHGSDAERYREMMDSKQGWDYILECFRNYCEEKLFN
ncbi:ATPase [Candidatus Falkowbacteria bacterium]|jgi:hypothetical protein|nr:hypothetical protein [Paludibacter sp.]MDD4429372.1 hypothetical protein [Paludibacter sp.]NCU35223.1 ATPase [Candidatus Falkowbacteria bacterium]